MMLILIAAAAGVFASVSVQIGQTNMTIFDSSEFRNVYETTVTYFYANYTNATSGNAISDGSCSLYLDNVLKGSMDFNSTEGLYKRGLFAFVGNHSYNVSCNSTSFAWLNATNNITIPNRNPQIVQSIPPIAIDEDVMDVFNLSPYFEEPDYLSQTLKWNYSSAANITISINNNTGIMNITPNADFYGQRNVTITAIDDLNATNSTNVTINVLPLPEVNLSFPANGMSGFYSNTSIEFKAIVSDDFSINNCTLYINGTSNATVQNPSVGGAGEAKNDSGTRTGETILTASANITEQLSLSSTQYTGFKVYAKQSSGGAAGPLVVYINNHNVFNITPSEVQTSHSWISKIVNSSYLVTGINNITFEDKNYNAINYYAIGSDATSQYMVRFTNDLIQFPGMSLPKGNYNWSVSCTNNQSNAKQASAWNFVVNNSAPTTPTTLTPASGTFDNEINISCSGSTDNDGDNLTYVLSYELKNNRGPKISIVNTTNGNYTWDVSELGSGIQLVIHCIVSDGITLSQNKASSSNYDDIQIIHPGSPNPPTNMTCNGGVCSNQIFSSPVSINCSGANDSDSNFTYSIEAYYNDWDGSKWKIIAEANASEGDKGFGNFTWNTDLIQNQTGISLRCNAKDGINADSGYFSAENISVQNSNTPSVPNVYPSSGAFDTEINVSCNGSTGAGTLTYQAYAYYKTGPVSAYSWNVLNDSLTANQIFTWDVSALPEQDINISCRAFNGTYYSLLNYSGFANISRAPTAPTEISPAGSNLYEYEIEYYCSGSNNTRLDEFYYNITAYYNDSSSKAWRVLKQDFAGDQIPNDYELAYDDGVYENAIIRDNSIYKYAHFSINVPAGEYSFCAKGYGTGSTPQIRFGWNCSSSFSGQNENDGICTDSSTISLSSSVSTYCTNITLAQGENQFQIKSQASGTAATYIDRAYLVSEKGKWNVSSLPAQRNVNISCYAYDNNGKSGLIQSSNITIDRIPKFNSTNFTNSYSWEYGSVSSVEINLTKHFYDEDSQALLFNASSASHFNVIINQTAGIARITPNSAELSGVSESVTFSADDSMAKGYSPSVSLSVGYKPSSGGSSGGLTTEEAEELVEQGVINENIDTTPQSDIPPSTTQPQQNTPGIFQQQTRKNNPESVIAGIMNTKVKHTRKFYVSGDKTRVAEEIKNIGFYNLEDVVIKVVIPKNVALSASEIIAVDQFTVFEEDPVIGFMIADIETGSTATVSYIINKPLSEFEISQILVEIIPRNLSEAELSEVQKDIEKITQQTAEVINITTKTQSDFEKNQTALAINLDLKEGVILYNVSIFAEIPKCLVEILKKEMIESDIEFEIINEDPLIKWHFDTLSSDDEINYLIKKVADENCTNQINVLPLAHQILLKTAKAKLANAIIPLLLIPIIIFTITFFSAYGYEQKEKVQSLNHAIAWARKKRRQGFRDEVLAEYLKQGKYATNAIKDILKFSSSLPRLIFTKMEIDIEELIVLLLILLNLLDFLKLLPGEVSFAKVVVSWTIIGYILFKASITRVLFGNRSAKVDCLLLAAYFMLMMKNLSKIAETEFLHAGFMKDMYILIANNAYFFESTLFIAGIAILLAVSAWIAAASPISRKSFLGALGEFGSLESISKKAVRAVVVFLGLLFFFIVVFNLMMEWLALAVDASLLTAAIVFYLFVLIKHRQKHWLVKTVYKIGNLGERFYEEFVELFHNRKTILVGISGMLILHTLTAIGIFIVPYVLGIYNPVYFASWQEGHIPIFNIFGWARQLVGLPPNGTSLFSEGIAGMGFAHSAVLFGVYALNIIAIVALLALPAVVWAHLYRNRKLPSSAVPKIEFSKITVSVFAASFTSFALASAFTIKGIYLKGLMGVDILTNNIAVLPNLEMVLAASAAAGILSYIAMSIAPFMKKAITSASIIASFAFFFNYIFIFFTSVISFYSSTISLNGEANPFISLSLLVFMAVTILFYGAGLFGLMFELWLRNELGIRSLFGVKELPEWMHHFDMAYLHHEKAHDESVHGEKIELLKNYITTEVRRGFRISIILKHISKVGWSEKSIGEAMREAKEDADYRKIMSSKKHKSSREIAVLASYIEKESAKNVLLYRLIPAIIRKGWNDEDIADAIILVRI